MKKLIVLASLLFVTQARAQKLDHFAWVKLSGNRVLVNVQLLSMRADSLIVLRDGKRVVVPILHILGLKVLREGSILSGTAMGAGLGAFAGAAVGVLASSADKNSWSPASASLYGFVIGGIIGAVTSSAGNSDRMLDLESASMDERILVLRDLVEELQKE